VKAAGLRRCDAAQSRWITPPAKNRVLGAADPLKGAWGTHPASGMLRTRRPPIRTRRTVLTMSAQSIVELSVAFLSFLFVFLLNMTRYSLREGVFMLPFAARLSRAREPRKFYLALGLSVVVAMLCLATVSGYVLKSMA
jgi:hypothetical protein